MTGIDDEGDTQAQRLERMKNEFLAARSVVARRRLEPLRGGTTLVTSPRWRALPPMA